MIDITTDKKLQSDLGLENWIIKGYTANEIWLSKLCGQYFPLTDWRKRPYTRYVGILEQFCKDASWMTPELSRQIILDFLNCQDEGIIRIIDKHLTFVYDPTYEYGKLPFPRECEDCNQFLKVAKLVDYKLQAQPVCDQIWNDLIGYNLNHHIVYSELNYLAIQHCLDYLQWLGQMARFYELMQSSADVKFAGIPYDKLPQRRLKARWDLSGLKHCLSQRPIKWFPSMDPLLCWFWSQVRFDDFMTVMCSGEVDQMDSVVMSEQVKWLLDNDKMDVIKLTDYATTPTDFMKKLHQMTNM